MATSQEFVLSWNRALFFCLKKKKIVILKMLIVLISSCVRADAFGKMRSLNP